jgi:anaerobic magnesium-protoporphyrin IX monomethyl ester cyclase
MVLPPTRVLLVSMPDTFMGFSIAANLPNLGLVSIVANRNPEESTIKVFDLVLRRHRVLPALKNILDSFHADIVGMNCMTFQYFTARKLSKWIKEYNPNIKIIMGGYHPSLCYDEIGENVAGSKDCDEHNYEKLKSNPWCDYIVRGEGETTFREFIHAYREKLPLGDIKGLSWRDEKGIFHHNPRQDCVDLATLKLPDRSARIITKFYHIAGKKADMVETSRGCNNACKFCSIRQMYGRDVGIRYYALDRVMQDIKNCDQLGARAILFIDDNITMDPKRLENLCDMIIEAKKKGEIHKNTEFHTQASAAGLLQYDTLIPKMGKAGFGVVFFGIENISKKNLAFFKKSIPIKRLHTLVAKLHANNIISFGGFILGNPNDDLNDMERNLKFAKLLNLDFPAFQILTPFPKTEIRDELRDQGLLVNSNNYSLYHGLYANVKTKHLETDFLQHELLRYYYRYYTLVWFLTRLNRVGIIKKYYRYIYLILKKYGKLAISTWMKAYKMKKLGLKEKVAENKVLTTFEEIRDKRLDGLLKNPTDEKND